MSFVEVKIMNRLLLTCLLIFLVMTAGQAFASEVSFNDGAEILFARYYANWAWGFDFKGTIIDSAGNIYSFNADNARKDTGLTQEPMTMLQIKQAFGDNLKPAGKVDETELKTMIELIKEAAEGTMSERVSKGMDMGSNVIVAFNKTDADLYKMVLLKQTGDWHTHNTASAATIITRWLSGSAEKGSAQPLPAIDD